MRRLSKVQFFCDKSTIFDGLDLHKPDVCSKPAGILNEAHVCEKVEKCTYLLRVFMYHFDNHYAKLDESKSVVLGTKLEKRLRQPYR